MSGERSQMQAEAMPSLETLIGTYGNDVLRTAYLYVKDLHTAEDMFQEVFIKVNRCLSGFRGDSSVKTWLMRITINTCKDYLKSAYHRNVVPLMEFQENALTSENDFDEIERKETGKEIREAVMMLPELYRDVVVCVYFQNMSVAEAAAALELPEGTVKSRLSRAKEKLKESLERRYGNEI